MIFNLIYRRVGCSVWFQILSLHLKIKFLMNKNLQKMNFQKFLYLVNNWFKINKVSRNRAIIFFFYNGFM